MKNKQTKDSERLPGYRDDIICGAALFPYPEKEDELTYFSPQHPGSTLQCTVSTARTLLPRSACRHIPPLPGSGGRRRLWGFAQETGTKRGDAVSGSARENSVRAALRPGLYLSLELRSWGCVGGVRHSELMT